MNINRLKRISEDLDAILSEPIIADPGIFNEEPVIEDENPNDFEQLDDIINDIDGADLGNLTTELDEALERYLVVAPCEGGFLPNTNVEYNAEILLYQGDKIIQSVMFVFKEQTEKEIIELAKDYFDNITDDIRVKFDI